MNQRERTTKEPREKIAASKFFFVGNALALDLLNTEVIMRGKKRDLLSSPEDLAAWWQKALGLSTEQDAVEGAANAAFWTNELLEAIKTLRTALRSVVISLIEQCPINPGDLAELNRLLHMGYQSLEVTPEGELEPRYHAFDREKQAVLLSIALSALRLLTQGERTRLRKCKNERCIGVFYDTTRSATRHWCTLECMNRARSVQHYRQAKREQTALDEGTATVSNVVSVI
jgi:predicted RNA-binding Zn ribbon-like protein